MNFLNQQTVPLVAGCQLFDAQQCEQIKQILDTLPLSEAGVYRYGDVTQDSVDLSQRRGKVSLITLQNGPSSWYDSVYWLKITKAVADYTSLTGIQIRGNRATTQYTVYDSIGDKFDVHQDQGVSPRNILASQSGRMMRKISMTIELDDPNSYQGCQLYFEHTNQNMVRFDRQQGSCFAFPSYYKHRVSPLTSGVRKCIVVWFEGPWWV